MQVNNVFDALTLDGLGDHGACQGDSGGPVLLVDGTGPTVVAGTAIGGDISCRDEVYYSRVDRNLAWLDAQLAAFAAAGDLPAASDTSFDPWGCQDTSCGAGVSQSGLALAVAVLVLVARRRRAAAEGDFVN